MCYQLSKKHPYYLLATASMKHLTLRTAFLIVVTSARRASEIHALQADNFQFHSTGVSAFLHPKFIPKVGQQWHINRPIELPAMHTENDPELSKLCVKRQIHVYVNCTQTKRAPGVTQLLLCYGSKHAGKSVSKIRISQWLKDVVNDCYHKTNLTSATGGQGTSS